MNKIELAFEKITKKKHLIFAVISIFAVYVKYGFESALLYPAAMYAMFMPILLTIEIYLILKNKVLNTHDEITRAAKKRLIISIFILMISYWVIPLKMKLFAGSFASIILLILLIVELLNTFRKRIIQN